MRLQYIVANLILQGLIQFKIGHCCVCIVYLILKLALLLTHHSEEIKDEAEKNGVNNGRDKDNTRSEGDLVLSARRNVNHHKG